jgi:hypothetical protein
MAQSLLEMKCVAFLKPELLYEELQFLIYEEAHALFLHSKQYLDYKVHIREY